MLLKIIDPCSIINDPILYLVFKSRSIFSNDDFFYSSIQPNPFDGLVKTVRIDLPSHGGVWYFPACGFYFRCLYVRYQATVFYYYREVVLKTDKIKIKMQPAGIF